jgi:hypothetical protein
MNYPGFGWGGGFAQFIPLIFSGIFAVFLFLVAAGLLFLLVRFLLVGTRAAQLYVARHEPPRPVEPQPGPGAGPSPEAAPSSPVPTATAPTAPAATTLAATKPAVAKPATTPRTRKIPPAS